MEQYILDIFGIAHYELRDIRYGGTALYTGICWYMAKPRTTDVVTWLKEGESPCTSEKKGEIDSLLYAP